MRQRKLRGYVLPMVYVLVLMLVFGAVSLVTTLLRDNPSYLYSVDVMSDEALPVVGTDDKVTGVVKPYIGDKVDVEKSFYNIKDKSENQEKALILFENTYMKNTGILYSSSDKFECIAALAGKVINIKDDNILGKVVEVEHNTNLRTIYYSLEEISVKAGDTINQGDVIGTSGSSKIAKNKYSLLFEVYLNGTLINPEDFYKMDETELN